MTQSTFSIRMDDSLKNEFSKMCDAFGISMAAAINMFAKAVVRERRIPFEISAENDQMRRSMDSFLKIRVWRWHICILKELGRKKTFGYLIFAWTSPPAVEILLHNSMPFFLRKKIPNWLKPEIRSI